LFVSKFIIRTYAFVAAKVAKRDTAAVEVKIVNPVVLSAVGNVEVVELVLKLLVGSQRPLH
jgi:hypothetical protein